MKRRSFLGISASIAAIPLFPSAAEACEGNVRGEQLNVTSGPGDGHSHVIFLRYPLKTKAG